MAEFCPMDTFLDYISDEERIIQALADGKSLREIVQEFQKSYRSYGGAKQAALRRLASEVQTVLGRIFREEGQLYSAPLLESLKERAEKARSHANRSQGWWYRRRKDSVFVTVGNRRGAVRQDEYWKLRRTNASVFVEFPDGKGDWFPVV